MQVHRCIATAMIGQVIHVGLLTTDQARLKQIRLALDFHLPLEGEQFPLVPAKAGTQINKGNWIPAYARMSGSERLAPRPSPHPAHLWCATLPLQGRVSIIVLAARL